jgi:hypoxanthine phosphoribosyltransferase
MYNKKPVIDILTYHQDLQILCEKINAKDFDCIIALKRSGWIVGAFLSNQKTIPVFTVSEIKSIPPNFQRFLIVDDKVCTGKSLNRVVNKLPDGSYIKTAAMYVESDKFPDIWVNHVKCIHGMWYER